MRGLSDAPRAGCSKSHALTRNFLVLHSRLSATWSGMKPRHWVVLGVVAACVIHHCQATDEPVAPAPQSATARASFTALIAHLPTPAQLRHHAIYIEPGALGFTGTVKDDDGEPIAGATITLGPRATVSDAEGGFAFGHLASGRYQVTGEHGEAFGQGTIGLDARDVDPTLALVLHVGPTLRVRVVAVDGSPVGEAEVEINGRWLSDGITDAEGRVVMRSVDTDTVYTSITAAGFARLHDRIDLGDDPRANVERTFVLERGAEISGIVVDEAGNRVPNAGVMVMMRNWRDAVDADANGVWTVRDVPAGRIAVNASSDAFYESDNQIIEHDGKTPKRDVAIEVIRGASATGTIVDEAGAPLFGIEVQIGRSSAHSDAAGHFEIVGIRPGQQELSAATPTLAAVPRRFQITGTQRLELRVVMFASSITGIVVDTHGEPVAHANVLARCTGEGCSSNGSSTTDDAGHFDVGGVPPGNYELTPQHEQDPAPYPSGTIVRSGTHGVRLVLADLGKLTGFVTLRGEPVPYFGIQAALEPDPNFRSPQPVRAANGAFTLKSLAPGTYSLEVTGPTFQTRRVAHFVVGDGGTTDVGNIAVDAGRIVRGRVVDERGQPIANAVVSLAPRGPWRGDITLSGLAAGNRVAHSASDGSFELAGVGAGEDLFVEAIAGALRSQEYPLGPEDDQVALVVEQTGTVIGHIEHLRERDGRVYLTSVVDYTSLSVDGSYGGEFQFEHVPAGDYELTVNGEPTFMQRVHVAADTTTTAVITLSTEPIELVVHAHGCDSIRLATTDNAPLTWETCAAGVATFSDVMPADYQACWDADACTAVTVTPGRPHQEVTLSAPSVPAGSADAAADPSAP